MSGATSSSLRLCSGWMVDELEPLTQKRLQPSGVARHPRQNPLLFINTMQLVDWRRTRDLMRRVRCFRIRVWPSLVGCFDAMSPFLDAGLAPHCRLQPISGPGFMALRVGVASDLLLRRRPFGMTGSGQMNVGPLPGMWPPLPSWVPPPKAEHLRPNLQLRRFKSWHVEPLGDGWSWMLFIRGSLQILGTYPLLRSLPSAHAVYRLTPSERTHAHLLQWNSTFVKILILRSLRF